MPKTKISEFSATPANNTDIDSINIAEGCAPSGINDAIRELMAQLKDFQTGAQGDSFGGPISGAVNATVGATTPNTGAFTTLSATGNVTLGDASTDTLNVGNGGIIKDASGNVGIATTPSAWGSSIDALQIGSTVSLYELGGPIVGFNVYNNGTNNKYITTDYASSYNQSIGQHKWYTAASGTAGNNISFTQAMTLTAAGNLGLGTTTPLALGGFIAFEVKGSSSGLVGVSSGAGTAYGRMYNGGSSVIVGTSTAHPLVFDTNDTERARIDSSGNLLVGTTTTVGTSYPGASFSPSTGGRTILALGSNNTGAGYELIQFYNPNGKVGRIETSGSATAYVTSSDYRLKENIAPMTGALAKVAALKPVTYKWKVDGSDGEGFIAHELAEVVPECVSGAKDAVDKDGKPVYQGIDTSFLVATLTAAIQELKAEFDAYKASHP
jgi:hypothetical protein